jgi:phosphopantothenoylcysteine decarboxylase/phosphopantothenate--cysteine ligase
MNVTLVVTGAIASAHLAPDLSWIRRSAPGQLERVVLTRSAQRFVTPAAASAIAGVPVIADEWADFERAGLHHVELGESAEVILVHPASAGYVVRLSQLAMESPSAATIACGSAPVVICPALPPRIAPHPLYRLALARLRQVPRYLMVDPVAGQSLVSAEAGRVPPPIWEVWRHVERARGPEEGLRAPRADPGG